MEEGLPLLTLPSPRVAGSHQLGFVVAILPFRGPGAYTKEVQMNETGALVVDGAEYIYPARADGAGAFSGHVAADGSGGYEFSGLARKDDNAETLAGTVAWTCSSS